MALSLICACGARFDVDETLAGQEVVCPECQQPLNAPAVPTAPLRTSDWALASVVLALAGAFTVVGSLAAVACGAVALFSILRERERLAGLGLAITGMSAGLVFTALTLVALSRTELFGLGARLREGLAADQIDTSGPDRVVAKDRTFEIVRPTKKWGVAKEPPKKAADDEDDDEDNKRVKAPGRGYEEVPEKPRPPRLRLGDAAAEALVSSKKTELLLVEPALGAFVDVTVDGERRLPRPPLEDYRKDILRDPHGPVDPSVSARIPHHNTDTALPGGGDLGEARETQPFTVTVRNQSWRMIVRFYRSKDGTVYIVRAYAREKNFDQAEPELRKALDSFRVGR
jgi:hypothetical protein